MVKNPPAIVGDSSVQSLGWEDPLEMEMATHFSILAWDIPWTEEPGRPQSLGSYSSTRLSTYTLASIRTVYNMTWIDI